MASTKRCWGNNNNYILQVVVVAVIGLVFISSINVNAPPSLPPPSIHNVSFLNRHSFPQGFIFGTASSAYQYEGGASPVEGGLNNWDVFTHKYPEKIKDRSNGDVAVDSYHRYKEDVGIMKGMGFDAYRFSISWSRILRNGKPSGGVNLKGVEYYNNLINELIKKEIKPVATLFHFDIPQALEEEYGGFLKHDVVKDFTDYAEVCFKLFGDRVKHWITLNEPYTYTANGYASGSFAPGRCSDWQNLNCTGGDSATEPYTVTHNQLLAHAAAVKLYRDKYQQIQRGIIGITLSTYWFVPFSNATYNRNAASRAMDFMFGWFLEPVVFGHYPETMRKYVGIRLPVFKEEEAKLVKESYDFIGVNYYAATYARYAPFSNLNPAHQSYLTDSRVNLTGVRYGKPIGPKGASDWLYIYPKGIRNLLLYVQEKYNNPLIYITENGVDELNNATLTLEEALNDKMRIYYFDRHLHYLAEAIKDGVNVKGYFAWSLLDNFEWSSGYTVRFGINYIDYNNGLRRYPKSSVHWFKKFLKK